MAAVPTTNHKGVPLMSMAPITALNVRAATEDLALSARPDAGVARPSAPLDAGRTTYGWPWPRAARSAARRARSGSWCAPSRPAAGRGRLLQ
jgi:hypothetical protein